MRTFVVVLATLFAMAFAQSQDHSVRVVEQPGQTYNIVQNPDSAFYRPTNPNGGNGGLNILPDPTFGVRPSLNSNGQSQPSIGPTFVQNSGRPPYPYKQYDNPNARGGK